MTFLNPLFLLGILLAGVPIIIHLWFQKRLKKIPFSTLAFLKKSEAKRFGWLKFREVFILIMRCLFVIFLFLSLSKPRLQNRLFKAGRLASVYFIVDNSYSMSYGENFKLAKKMATNVLSFYSPNSEFYVLPLCDVTKADKPFWVTKKSVPQLIDKLDLSYKSGSIKDVLLRSVDKKPRYQTECIYIGDGQEINFKDFSETLIDCAHFYWLNIPAGSNVGITKVVLKDPIAVAVDDYILNVELTNFSSQAWIGKTSLRVGEYYLEQDCEIQPRQHSVLEFLLPVSMKRGQVEIYDDSLLIDNVYFFSKLLPREVKVIIVGSDEFLHLALESNDGLKTPFYLTSVSTLSGVDLRKYNVVVLSGINEISESDKIRLSDFLNREDTGIICFLEDGIGDNLRNFIARCCTIEKQIIPKGYATLEWFDHEHQIFKTFPVGTVLKNTKFYRFQKIITDKGVIAKVSGDYPLIVIRENLAVIATQITPQTTDIMYKTAFVPLFYRLVTNLVFKSPNKEFYVGDKVDISYELTAPTGEYLIRGSEFLLPGFYTMNTETLGINVIPKEGDLKTLGSERTKILNIQLVDLEKDLLENDLSTFFLILALFAIFLELIVLLIR